MSRTIKGKKVTGFDFWTARPFNQGGGGKGPYAKKRTHRAERAQGRRDLQEGIGGA